MTKKLILTVAFFMILQFSFAQTKSISGIVVDEAGLPLMGATVLVKGTNIGTQTDLEGSYTIKAEVGRTLVFSFIGMTSVEKKVTQNSSQIYVTLIQNSEELDEVVVVTTGYQDVKKDQMTGSVSVITAKDIRNLNVKSVDEILVGRIAGVSSYSSGEAGTDAVVRVRGVNSLQGNTDPIWIVDGMPLQGEAPDTSRLGPNISKSLFQNGLANISPNDIESITILKDAAASAIYGARAANGVIVIKTKSGSEGAPRYNVTIGTGVSARPVNPLTFMNSKQKLAYERSLYYDLGIVDGRGGYILSQLTEGKITPKEAEAEFARLEQINTDWFKEMYRPGFSTQVSASMSGGNRKTRYYNSLNFLNQEGTRLGNNFLRLRLNTKFDHNFSDKFKVFGQLSTTYRNNDNTASSINGARYALYANPYETPNGYDMSYDMTRNPVGEGFAWETLNVKEDITKNTDYSRYLDVNFMTRIEWKPIDGLILNSQGSVYANTTNNRRIIGEHTYTSFQRNWIRSILSTPMRPDLALGSLTEGNSYATNYNLRNSVSYAKNIYKKHFINLFAGQELHANLSYGSSNYSPIFDQAHRIVGFPEFPKGTDLKKIEAILPSLGGTSKLESRLVSFFFNGTYSYDERYIISGSVRYDGSDIIGNKNQYTPLWNASARWNLHNEKFLKDVNFIDELAFRAGYGFTGSIDKNAFPFIVTTIGKRIVYDGLIIPSSFTYSNPNVKWQTKQDFNIGFDTSLFRGRLRAHINYYNNFVFDLLDQKTLALSSGRSHVVENVANLVNKGWEFDIAFSPIFNDKIQWNIRANLAINKNIVKKTFYKKIEDLPKKISPFSANSYFVEEYPVSAWYGYQFAEVNPETGGTLAYDENGKKFNMELLSDSSLGLDPPLPIYLGDRNPPIVGGFGTDFNWNRWVLSFNFEYKLGNMIMPLETFSNTKGNHLAIDANRWRSAGDIAHFPGLRTDEIAYSKYMYDVKLEKGDYLRATYCAIGYNLPDDALKALGASFARFTLSANNLFTLTRYSGLDPSQLGPTFYPNSRQYNLTLNFGF